MYTLKIQSTNVAVVGDDSGSAYVLGEAFYYIIYLLFVFY